jgi:Putative zinc-finger
MRHIPEDELHAYLDQGLSRTQCVEIESHLADCPSCQALRDGIAALRDRTTALLARLAPPRRVPPAYEVLRRRAVEAASQRRRRINIAIWAASLVAAAGLGWGASSVWRVSRPAHSLVPVAATPAPAVAEPRLAAVPESRRTPSARPALSTAPATPRAAAAAERAPSKAAGTASATAADAGPAASRSAVLSVLDPKPALELSKLEPPARRGDLEMGGMWRTMSWDGARAEAGERVPHIDGLPVVQVQVQNGERGSRPVMVVAQQLSSGQVIRTIEGPATDVSQLLSRRAMADVDSFFLPGDSTAAGADAGHAMAMQLGDRMLAITGDLPSDSLRAMIRRLNAEMRSK